MACHRSMGVPATKTAGVCMEHSLDGNEGELGRTGDTLARLGKIESSTEWSQCFEKGNECQSIGFVHPRVNPCGPTTYPNYLVATGKRAKESRRPTHIHMRILHAPRSRK